MTSRFNRFLHIERSRGGKEPVDGQVSLRDGSRFESVATPGQEVASPPAVPEAHLERFKPPEEPTPRLDASSTREHRFSRCIRCETENGRFALQCTTCGADLRARAQQEEDEKRWLMRVRAEEKAREELQLRRAEGAARPRPVADPGAEPPSLFLPSLGMGLLRRLPTPAARGAGVAGAVLLPVLLTRAERGPLWVLGIYLGVFVAASFVPSEIWMKRGRDE
jgi:hypothetical protein